MGGLLDRVRQPAYTGENRCVPCTVANLAIVAVAAAATGLLAVPVGVAVAVLGVGAVWLWGYVVPGTPTLTRRYFPDRVLAWFGKAPARAPPDGDPEERLAALGVLESAEGAAPTLTSTFREEWTAAAATLAEDRGALRAAAGEALSVDPGVVEVVHPEEGGVTLQADGGWVGQWPSEAALVADLATERVLAGPRWDGLDRVERADLAARIRGLAERCPACGDAVSVSEDTVTSCCRSAEVVAVTCTGCEARLAEFDPAPAAFAPGR